MKKKVVLLIISLVAGLSSSYAEEMYPKGCQPIILRGENIKLAVTKPAVFLLHNLSASELWLTHPNRSDVMSAGWSSRLQAGYWSALTTDEKNFILNCIESRPGHEQQISCADVMAVCKFPNVTLPENTSGTFWAGEDRPVGPLIAYIKRRGFLLEEAPHATKVNGEE